MYGTHSASHHTLDVRNLFHLSEKDEAGLGVDHLDIVTVNVGVFYAIGKVPEIKISDIQCHCEPNVYELIRLYQTTLPLLLKSTNRKLATIESSSGHIEVSSPVFCFLKM